MRRTASSTGTAVYGHAMADSGQNYGVYGVSDSYLGYGVYGLALNYAIWGQAIGPGGYGVTGVSVATTGYGIGIFGQANSSQGTGVYGTDGGAGGYAGYFFGPVHVTGLLTKGSGAFKIDHPLDPANKYLYHSFVESPDMKNIYDGVVTLDESGAAWVELPAWFEALNKDFRYLLTPLGVSMPNLYITAEIKDNRFQIAGGAPGARVSWQVTGIRHDPFAEAYRIPVEEVKPPEEQGLYLYPQVYGKPASLGVDYQALIGATESPTTQATPAQPE